MAEFSKTMAEPLTSQRADKYLHHVRIFKTRSIATQACTKGNVLVKGQAVKPSRELRIGDVVMVKRGELEIHLRVLAFAPQRIGAPIVSELLEDLTPAENYRRAAERRKQRALETPNPHELIAKPNKQQMRQLREWWGQD